MDAVDIGGAAKSGRPKIPRPQTVSFDADSGQIQALDEKGRVISTGGAPDAVARESGAVPVKVAAASRGHAVAYPEEHPANREDLERTGDGLLVLKKGQHLSEGPNNGEAIGDVREKYIGPVYEEDSAKAALPAAPGPAVTDNGVVVEDKVAVDKVGAPLVEVLYRTTDGVVVSHYHQAVRDGNFLIFVVNNNHPAAQRFIPRPDPENPRRFSITITDKNRKSEDLVVIPTGINFTVGVHDFFVMVVPPNEG